VEEGDVAHNQRGAPRQPVGKARGCRAGRQVGAGKAGKGPERVRVGRTVAGDAARTGRQLGPAWRCTGKQGRQGSTGSTRTCGKHAVDAAGAAGASAALVGTALMRNPDLLTELTRP
jgi:hypothetical protein